MKKKTCAGTTNKIPIESLWIWVLITVSDLFFSFKISNEKPKCAGLDKKLWMYSNKYLKFFLFVTLCQIGFKTKFKWNKQKCVNKKCIS